MHGTNYCRMPTIPSFICTYDTKSMIRETVPALYFCQAALMPKLEYADSDLHVPTKRTRSGMNCETHAKIFDPPNIVSCANPQQLCRNVTVFMEIPYARWIILPHQPTRMDASSDGEMRRSANRKHN